ncbi:uncharacterized protein Z518_02969 [Rhinocladiella mackenziei CBS 650.93]|uniref:Rhinocladiella mackenziei CBS 650.93 unplaced genomic scaffold supercont1.2, whole genome shotgun sequence n=1 Tax=Rhinocladiella mackenziei CBS 650.93 TaxID=1442369 RepID=A0A0D2HCW6_9EURO|nr:uncharacterized protein Z518_02969 [Rhinocladiella mackenziei CBS 650.93]KIX08313.1 hypothetical protein Z518_02969 [Rhinocladiella mackenziei CBS 650.93]
MSTFFYGNHQQHQSQNPNPMPQSHNHHGRSRRAPRISAQNSHRQFRGPKIIKEIVTAEAPSITAYRARFEAGRSFDLDDDLEFCPNLLSLDERQSVTSGSSDRSSLSSGSPDSSPLQSQIQPQQITPALSISSAATSAYMSPPTTLTNNNNNLKIHQPSAIRSRANAIPIVNPSTGTRIASPPSSISPGTMQQTTAARRW